MIRFLIAIPLFVAAVIVAVSLYLQPNDLIGCGDAPSLTTDNCASVDAVVVISGGDTNARTDEAVKLFKNGWAPKLVLSGAAEDKSGPSNAAAMKARAVSSGVPASAIYLDESSETTKQNATYAQSIFIANDISSIVLVTSGYHQKRASLEFSKSNSNIVIKNSPLLTDKDWSMWWWTSPRGWTLAASELFKIIVFYAGAST